MRNLKRALSLALASVMLMGMMVVGAGAKGIADFKDADEIVNQDAVAVTTEIGIFEGYEDGTFGPEKVVTRAEMAVIICKMLYGADVNASAFVATSVFTDVPDWAAGYVNLCASLGIVAGVGDNKYDPNSTVTTAQAALMLTKALGYFKNEADYGSNWMLASTSKATQLGLYGGMQLEATEGLTRDSVAEMTFNALTSAVPVEYSDMFNVYYNTNSGLIYGLEFSYIETLGYTNFDLVYKRGGTTDAQGRPAVTWGTGTVNTALAAKEDVVDDKGDLIGKYVTLLTRNEIITMAMAPDYTYTSGTKAKAINADLGKDVVKDGIWTVYYNGQKLDLSDTNVKFDNDYDHMPTAKEVKTDKTYKAGANMIYRPASGDAGDYNWIINGEVAEIYLEGNTTNNDHPYVTVVIYGNYLGEVDRVRTDSKGEYITISDDVMAARTGSYELNTKDFYTGEYKEDDMVGYTIGYVEDDDDFFMFSVNTPETAEGSVTAIVMSDMYVRLDGTKITLSQHYNEDVFYSQDDLADAELKNDYRLYLDPNGYILSIEALEDSVTRYLYIEAISKVRTTVEADVVFSDGTKETIKVSELYDGYDSSADLLDSTSAGYIASDADAQRFQGHAYAYTMSGSKYVLTRLTKFAAIGIDNEENVMEWGTDDVRLTDETIFVDIGNGKIYTGYKNVPDYAKNDSEGAYGYAKKKSNWAEIVFITAGDPSNEKDTFVWVAKAGEGDSERVRHEDDTRYHVFENSYLDGTKMTDKQYELTEGRTGLYTVDTPKSYDRVIANKAGLYQVTKTDGNGAAKEVEFWGGRGANSTLNLKKYADGNVAGAGLEKPFVIDSVVGNNSAGTIWYDNDAKNYTWDSNTVFVTVDKDGNVSTSSSAWKGITDDDDWATTAGDYKYNALWIVEVGDTPKTAHNIVLAYIFEDVAYTVGKAATFNANMDNPYTYDGTDLYAGDINEVTGADVEYYVGTSATGTPLASAPTDAGTYTVKVSARGCSTVTKTFTIDKVDLTGTKTATVAAASSANTALSATITTDATVLSANVSLSGADKDSFTVAVDASGVITVSVAGTNLSAGTFTVVVDINSDNFEGAVTYTVTATT